MGRRIWSFVAAFYLLLCVMLGGASAAGAIANATLQTIGVLLVLALLWTSRIAIPREAKPLLWILGLFVAVVLVSLIPLPLSTWEGLPFRGELAAQLRGLGIESGALAASLNPRGSLESLLWLIPPVALFLLVMNLPPEERRRLPGTLIIIALVSGALGVFQVLGGESSQLRFYQVTNRGSPVGFFSNVNHNVTLLLCALPCVGFLAARFATRPDRSRRGGGAMISISSLVFLIVLIGLAGSMAGYGLVLPVAFAALLIYKRAVTKTLSVWWKLGFGALLVAFAGVALLGPLSSQNLSDKFDDFPTSRKVIAETTVEAIGQSFPLGTGLATFSDVYRRFEDPAEAHRIFVNHVHNDYLEFVLELGIAGILLILAFIGWWAWRTWRVWTEDFKGVTLARTGSVMVGVVLLHSIVDYPLRTSAIAAVFALGCALMVPFVLPPEPSARRDEEVEGERLRHLEAV